MNSRVFTGANLSEVWASAFLCVAGSQHRELSPLVATVTTPFGVQERQDIRDLLEQSLRQAGQPGIDTVASTIFPKSQWDPNRPRDALFKRYDAIWPRIKRVRQNNRGTYFRRFTSFGDQGLNQLDTVLRVWQSAKSDGRGHRRSALQLAVLDPTADRSEMPRLGFPCLHQVSIVPGADGCLSIAGFYATQTMFEKAYGNYLGLAQLGMFVAHELNMTLASVTCVAAVGLLTQVAPISKKEGREDFCRALSALVPASR